MEGLVTIGLIASVVVLVWLLIHVYKKSQEELKERVARVNQAKGLSFVIDPHLSTWNWKEKLLFDRKNKKLLYMNDNADEVLEYANITQWEYLFSVRARDNKSVEQRIVLRTTDFDRPQLIFAVANADQGREWVARLDVIFNRENQHWLAARGEMS